MCWKKQFAELAFGVGAERVLVLPRRTLIVDIMPSDTATLHDFSQLDGFRVRDTDDTNRQPIKNIPYFTT